MIGAPRNLGYVRWHRLNACDRHYVFSTNIAARAPSTATRSPSPASRGDPGQRLRSLVTVVRAAWSH